MATIIVVFMLAVLTMTLEASAPAKIFPLVVVPEIMEASATAPPTIFQSNVDGIRVQVPNGWTVDDTDNTDPIVQQSEKNLEFAILARLCPQTEMLPKTGGDMVVQVEQKIMSRL
jgi:hypothetical protein